jgi:hypothetical protein
MAPKITPVTPSGPIISDVAALKVALSERASDGESDCAKMTRSALVALLLGDIESDDDIVEVDVAVELAVDDSVTVAERIVSREPMSATGSGAIGPGGGGMTTTGTAIGAGGGSGGAGGTGTGISSTGTIIGAGGGSGGGAGGGAGGSGAGGGPSSGAAGDGKAVPVIGGGVLTAPTASMKIGTVGSDADGDGCGVSIELSMRIDQTCCGQAKRRSSLRRKRRLELVVVFL